MYPRIPWELFANPLRSAEHTLGTTDVEHLVTFYYYDDDDIKMIKGILHDNYVGSNLFFLLPYQMYLRNLWKKK
jgi:hypothetical protein